MDPVLLALGAYWLLNRKPKPGDPRRVNGGGAPEAFLYQLPQDGYTTTRLAVSMGGDDPKEVGIFSSPDAAIRIATGNGWTVQHGGQVLALAHKPGEGS